MSDDAQERKWYRFEAIKAATTFISSVIIAAAGIGMTYLYNSKQLEVAQEQAKAQTIIARNKELATLIPNLGSENAQTRKFNAISLALYGSDAIPALIALLKDEAQEVRMAGVQSLSSMGNVAIEELTRIFNDQQNDYNFRAAALYTLGRLRAPHTYELATATLANLKENRYVRKDAVQALEFLKDERAAPFLFSTLRTEQTRDALVLAQIVFALGELPNVSPTNDLMSLLDHRDEHVRYTTVWTLGKIGGKAVLPYLERVASNDASPRVQQAAEEVSAWVLKE